MTIRVTATFQRQDRIPAENSECQALLKMWNKLCAGRPMPPWRGFDWSGVPTRIIPFCGVVDVVVGPPLDFVYRFWGTAHVRAHGQEMTGKSAMAMRPRAEAASVFSQYKETLEARRPLFFVNTMEVGEYHTPYREFSLRLPFSDNGETIDKIFAFSDLRIDYESLVRDLTHISDAD